MYSKFRQNRFKREKEIAKEVQANKEQSSEIHIWQQSNELNMNVRVMQIWGFFLTVLGWIFITCSLAMEGWKVAAVGGQGGSSVIYITQYWSSLWRTCSTASNAVSNCYDFPMLWSVESKYMS